MYLVFIFQQGSTLRHFCYFPALLVPTVAENPTCQRSHKLDTTAGSAVEKTAKGAAGITLSKKTDGSDFFQGFKFYTIMNQNLEQEWNLLSGI